MEILEFTSSVVFNYFFSIYVYISIPIIAGISVMSLIKNN